MIIQELSLFPAVVFSVFYSIYNIRYNCYNDNNNDNESYDHNDNDNGNDHDHYRYDRVAFMFLPLLGSLFLLSGSAEVCPVFGVEVGVHNVVELAYQDGEKSDDMCL